MCKGLERANRQREVKWSAQVKQVAVENSSYPPARPVSYLSKATAFPDEPSVYVVLQLLSSLAHLNSYIFITALSNINVFYGTAVP